jgi:hypothetical protein
MSGPHFKKTRMGAGDRGTDAPRKARRSQAIAANRFFLPAFCGPAKLSELLYVMRRCAGQCDRRRKKADDIAVTGCGHK